MASDYSLSLADMHCYVCSLDDCDDYDPDCKRSQELGLRMRPKIPLRVGPKRITTLDIDEEIRQRYAAGGILGKELALDYDVSLSLIYQILGHRRVKDISDSSSIVP